MAQAARLCLRMQKELKLLLSDPPPGASFPHLSSAAVGSGDLSSLSTIDAQIEGPEGTVYANGIFNVKIQIPERYPFQPPIVAFATPIYHPNIDNGGRICLDILNLPPKGAWQPSLNISTVLMSIGLLLSEPNPDDGLMCEASREYKYHRQAFDHKARAMTEKYAKAGASGSSISCQVQNDSSTSMIHGDERIYEATNNGFTANDIKPSGIFSITRTTSCDMEANNLPDHSKFHSNPNDHKDANGKRKAETFGENIHCNEKPQMSRRKLSLASSGQAQKEDKNHNEPSSTNDMNSGSCPSQDIQKSPVSHADTSTSFFSMDQRQSETYGDSTTGSEYKESCSVVRKLSLGLKRPPVKQECNSSNKENAALANNLPISNPQTASKKTSRKLFLRPPTQLQVRNLDNFATLAQQGTNQIQDNAVLSEDFEKSGLREASMSETIVLDSDDSAEEETASSKTRLSLARRGIRKQKNRA